MSDSLTHGAGDGEIDAAANPVPPAAEMLPRVVPSHPQIRQEHTKRTQRGRRLDRRERQQYNCLMIPTYDSHTGTLPPGIHEAPWSEILVRYGSTPHRLRLLAGLHAALISLRQAGCRRVYLDGSFVTAKPDPNDFDGCWEMAGVDFDLLDHHAPLLLDWSRRRAAQKATYGGELFRDRNSGQPKGIVALKLGDLP